MLEFNYRFYLDALSFEPAENTFIEIWQHPEGEPTIRIGRLTEDNIQEWLNESAAVSNNSRVTTAGLRLILCPRHPSDDLHKLPFSKATFENIMATFALPQHYPQTLHQQDTQFAKFTTRTSAATESVSFVLHTVPHDYPARYCLGLSYDPSQRVTCGLLHGQFLASNEHVNLAMIRGSPSLAWHPMFLPALIAQMLIKITKRDTDYNASDLANLEARTGHHPYARDISGNLMDRTAEPFALDLGDLTRQLNSRSSDISFVQMRAGSVRQVLQSTLAFIDYVELVTASRTPEVHMALKDNIEYLRSMNDNLLLRMDHLQRNAQTQLSVVYNFIAQRDSRVNVELARDSKSIAVASKRDSSSMKTIAALTMVFLPGTFVASFFAMPLFNWQAEDGSPIVTAHF